VGRLPPAMVERGKFDHIEERLRAIERGGDYHFPDMAKFPTRLNNINTQPILVLLITHHPTSQEHPIIHKGRP